MDEATASIITGFMVALPPTLMAWAALRQGKVNAAKATETGVKVDTIGLKTDSIVTKANDIHALTNSNLTAVTTALQVANEKISGLEKLILAQKPGGK